MKIREMKVVWRLKNEINGADLIDLRILFQTMDKVKLKARSQ